MTMRLHIKTTKGQGGFGGLAGNTDTVELELEARCEDEAAAGTVTATQLLGVLGLAVEGEVEVEVEVEKDTEPDQGDGSDDESDPLDEHPAMPDLRRLIEGAILTVAEAKELRALVAVAEQQGKNQGIADGR